MLRGAQTVGELRGRSERIHDFADLEEVERVLETLAAREPPLVRSLPRGRWAQTLGGSDDVEEPEAASTPEPALAERVTILEREVAGLKQALEVFRKQFE